MASFYGLRRSEVLGLKWDAIDFEANTMEVKRIVTQASIDGKKSLFRPTVQNQIQSAHPASGAAHP